MIFLPAHPHANWSLMTSENEPCPKITGVGDGYLLYSFSEINSSHGNGQWPFTTDIQFRHVFKGGQGMFPDDVKREFILTSYPSTTVITGPRV